MNALAYFVTASVTKKKILLLLETTRTWLALCLDNLQLCWRRHDTQYNDIRQNGTPQKMSESRFFVVVPNVVAPTWTHFVRANQH